MKISGGYNNFDSINSFFTTLHQGKIQQYANQLSNSKVLFPDNKSSASNLGIFGKNTATDTDAAQYVSDIKKSSGELSSALSSLTSGAAFKQKEAASTSTSGTSGTSGTETADAKTAAAKHKPAIDAVHDVVKGFNDLFTAASSKTGDPKAQSLASRLMNVGSAYSKSLSDIGISFNSSGKMTVNSEKLGQAAESGKLEQFFTQDAGRNYGFANQLSKLANNVSNNTSSFVSTSSPGNSFGTGSIFDYLF